MINLYFKFPPMSVAIITVLISSSVTMLVGIANFMSTLNTLKHNQATALELERLKEDIDKKKQARLFLMKQAEKEIQAIDRAIACIQGLRETLYRAIISPQDTISTKVFIEDVKQDIEKLVVLYENDFSSLKSVAQRSVHDIKRFSGTIPLGLNDYLSEGVYVNLSDEQKDALIDRRNWLTEQQIVLRDMKYNIITEIAS